MDEYVSFVGGLDNGFNGIDGCGNGAKVVRKCSGDYGGYGELGVDPWATDERKDGHGKGAALGNGTSAFVGGAEANGH